MVKKKRHSGVYYERQAALWLVRGRDSLEDENQKKMVADAINCIGDDLVLPSQREQLKKCILLNCEDRKSFCFRYLDLPFISERDFYRRKEHFLSDVWKKTLKKSKEK